MFMLTEISGHLHREKPAYATLGRDHECHLADQAGMGGPVIHQICGCIMMGGGRGCAPGALLKVRATARTSCGDKPASERYSGKFARCGNPSAYGTSVASVAKFNSVTSSQTRTENEGKRS